MLRRAVPKRTAHKTQAEVPSAVKKKPCLLLSQCLTHAILLPLLGFLLMLSTSSAWAEPVDQRKSRIGVSIAGAEFGEGHPHFSNEMPGIPGKHYTFNSEETVRYFCERGITLLRLPLRWERLQPRLSEKLDAEELQRVRTFVSWARKYDGKVVLDIHNYARYHLKIDGKPRACIIDEKIGKTVPVSRADFADLWRRLARAFQDNPTIYAYGLMNEPHDMGTSDWKAISQAAVDAIRAEEDKKLIFVAGDGWSNAHRFGRVNGEKAWITDPINNVAYEAHCYFDHDFSGRYGKTYEEELAADPNLAQRPVKRIMPFVKWCRRNQVRGFLGEFGVPASDERWLGLLDRCVDLLRQEGMDGCYWAAGEWWGNYPLSIQPRNEGTEPAPQMKSLLR